MYGILLASVLSTIVQRGGGSPINGWARVFHLLRRRPVRAPEHVEEVAGLVAAPGLQWAGALRVN